ncbi:MAG: hypothetical protein WB760_20290 [Xanthobacteraceae bacterium]
MELERSVALSLYPLRSRATSAAPNKVKQGDGWPIALVSLKSPIPKNVYASAMGLCNDSIMT